MSLQLNDYRPPMVVIVPEEAVIYPEERVTVIWESQVMRVISQHPKCCRVQINGS